MKLDKFVKAVKKLSTIKSAQPIGIISAMWVAEEGAEVLKVFKSAVKDGEPINEDDLKEEMGDVLTSLANLANEMNFSLDDMAEEALVKLESRVSEEESED